jgi:hypothetical protein
MSEIITGLQAEVERLEALYIGKLTKLGLLELIHDYQDIATLRDAAAIVTKRSGKSRNTKTYANSGASGAARTEPPEGFSSLKDEVRRAVGEITSERFRALDVFEILAERFPTYITEDKRGSIGATLSNLVTDEELTNEKDDQRKVWYRVSNLQPVTDHETDQAGVSEEDSPDDNKHIVGDVVTRAGPVEW